MISKTKLLASALILAVATGGVGCSEKDNRVDRWATTDNTNVQIDWDKINQAYKDASGPEDFEKRVNEIYEGDEVISIAVADSTDKVQTVTGFFDKNKSGSVDEGEKVFTIKREPTAEGQGQYQTQGYGPYAGYHSPFFSIVSGMVVGSMISSMFMPSYMPVAYVTSGSRVDSLHANRNAYRAQNPSKFNKTSRSGRTYGSPTNRQHTPSRPSRSGGGRFGLARRGRTVRPERLTA